MTISKKSTLLSCVIIIAVIVFFAASYISVTADMRRGMEDAFEGMAEEPRYAELENAYAENFAKIALTSGGLAIAAALIYMCFIRLYILGPLKEFSSALENMTSDGVDLTQRLESGGNDEIGGIAKAFNAFMDEMAKAIAEAQNTADAVTRALSEAALNADATDKGVKEISDNVKSFSLNVAAQTRGAEGFEEISAELLEDCHRLSDRISEASNAIDKIAGRRENVERNLSALTWRNEAGTENKEKPAWEISKINSQIACAAQIAGEIKASAEQAGRLSASVRKETASAGEHGEGFAAAAGVLNRLSGQTLSSALKIERLIASINLISAEAVAEVLKASEGQSAYVEEIKEIFSDISAEINTAGSAFGGIHQSLSAVTSVNAKMREGARTIQETGLENQRNAESAQAAIELQANAIEKIKALSHRSASAMKELKETLYRLKTGANEPGI